MAAIMIIVWLITLFISIFILHWIITSAINSSELVSELKEIKDILKGQNTNNLKKDVIKKEVIVQENKEDVVYEECPACGEQVLSTDMICKSCGLTLILKDDEKL